MSSSVSQTKTMAASALASFLQSRHVEVPSGDVSRALRRKQQREKRKRLRSHSVNRETTGGSDSDERNMNPPRSLVSKKKPVATREELEARQRVLRMRENKLKGKPIIERRESEDTDLSEEDD